jgi:hypothetical protein
VCDRQGESVCLYRTWGCAFERGENQIGRVSE